MGVSSGGPGTGLLDRRVERGAVDRVLDRARAGNSAVLVVHGEPGIGKTVVLDYAARRASASDLRVVRASGIESELELAYAALHQLCVPFLGRRLEQLPRPQRDMTLLWRAEELQGIPADAVVPAQAAGLVELGAQVHFAGDRRLDPRGDARRSSRWRRSSGSRLRAAGRRRSRRSSR